MQVLAIVMTKLLFTSYLLVSYIVDEMLYFFLAPHTDVYCSQ